MAWFSSMADRSPTRKCSIHFLIILVLLYAWDARAKNIEQLLGQIGGTFCRYLVYKGQIHRRTQCAEPSCSAHHWHHTRHRNSSKVVVSFAHNGFGNQLWEHSVAFMFAEALQARLLVAVIPDSLSPGGFIPPNTFSGYNAMTHLLPSSYIYDNLPVNSSIRALCDAEPFYLSDRPVDWKSRNYTGGFKEKLVELLEDKAPRCLKMLGYFQNLPLCAEDTRRLWVHKLITNFTTHPGANDISIYLRCIPRHYHWNTKEFYETILTHTKHDKVWLFTAPECPSKLGDNPNKDGPVAGVLRMLYSVYNATKWPQYTGPDENMIILHDLAGLVMSKKLILPSSSWAFWAGFLSNATEVHVNAPPIHQLMTETNYIYHSEKHRTYFGRYNRTENDILYAVDLNARDAIEKEKVAAAAASTAAAASGGAGGATATGEAAAAAAADTASGATAGAAGTTALKRRLHAAEDDFMEYLASIQPYRQMRWG